MAGPVWLLFSDGLMIEGSLLAEAHLMPFHGRTLPARKVQISASLASGTSGTWLIRGGSLCGMIIARYPGEPRALFITAEDILRDISSSFPLLRSLPPSQGTPNIDPMSPTDSGLEKACSQLTGKVSAGVSNANDNKDRRSSSSYFVRGYSEPNLTGMDSGMEQKFNFTMSSGDGLLPGGRRQAPINLFSSD
ncbi:hypothetical protein LZ32DRAFT_667735 [Colletotrichum eremochloae]|nr:hypothetical protein LZ32DRAFT_667735 [Colletotrichum eremochloae]